MKVFVFHVKYLGLNASHVIQKDVLHVVVVLFHHMEDVFYVQICMKDAHHVTHSDNVNHVVKSIISIKESVRNVLKDVLRVIFPVVVPLA